ncbi:MAG: polyprenyl synthetase family protein [Bacteroidales bacterium]|nr:polyprenyl synthetase family protein [Bacteroidales bacterium]MBN2821556.1 polyprenyl synthetase family protein [Bacteroidales bacterium]
MNTVKEIQQVVKEELKVFNTKFDDSMKSKIPLLNIVTNYLRRRKGKQVRPLLVFLSAKLIDEVSESTYTAAILIELLHTSTLVHDDVVDDAHERRGFLSINALWRSKIAVLLGDFLLAKGLLISIENNEFDLLKITSEAVQEMIEGEMHQLQKTRKLNLSEEEYFEIITQKTATLLASCTSSGARSVTKDLEKIALMKEFGLNLGIAFQIKDDLFDYEANSVTGKPKGNDIKEKKLTLPLIAALNNSPKNEKRKIINLINKKSSKRDTYMQVIKFVNEYNGIDYARNKMFEFRDKALSNLESFKDSDSKKALIALVNYIVERRK